MTVLDLVRASLRVLGVIGEGETPSGAVVEDATQALNLLLEEWNNDNLLTFTEQQAFNTVAGQRSYGIGNGQEWAGNKPMKVLSAFVSLDDVDHRLQIVGEKEYMEIATKEARSRPFVLYFREYDTSTVTSGFEYDCGRIYLYPTPDAVYSCTISSPKRFLSYSGTPSQEIDFDTGYISALKYALAVEVAPEYGWEPSAWVLKRAGDTMAAIRRRRLKRPQAMKLDGVLTGGSGRFNIDIGGYE